MTGSRLSDAEFKALGVVARARKENLANLFAGTHIAFGKEARRATAFSLANNGKAVYTQVNKFRTAVEGGKDAAKAAGKGAATAAGGPLRELAKEFIATCMNVPDIPDVIEALSMEVVEQLVSELVPYLTVLVSGVKSAKAWKAVYEDATNRYRSEVWVQGVLPGDPLAAAEAVQTIIERDLARHTADAARQTAMFGAKLGSLFVDYGAVASSAIGLANATASLAIELASIGIDYVEMKQGNKLLQSPGGITLKVFEKCPLLGCYLLTCSDDSMVANIFVADIGLPGWMTKVEQIKKNQLGPLQKVASKAIQASRLELVGIESNKGMIKEAGMLTLAKNKLTNHVTNFGRSVKARLEKRGQ